MRAISIIIVSKGVFITTSPVRATPTAVVVISGRLRLRIDFGQSQFLSVGYLFRCKLTEGLYTVDTQVTKRVISFWVQIAPLVVLAAVICALAAKYIW